MSDVKVTIRNESTVEVRTGASAQQIAGALEHAVAAGYVLSDASTITSGHQRDPYVVGVKLTFRSNA